MGAESGRRFVPKVIWRPALGISPRARTAQILAYVRRTQLASYLVVWKMVDEHARANPTLQGRHGISPSMRRRTLFVLASITSTTPALIRDAQLFFSRRPGRTLPRFPKLQHC